MFPGDPLKKMNVRDNRASNLKGKVRTVYNSKTKKYETNSKNHQGFDFAASSGTETMAVNSGEIVNVSKDKGAYGKTIELKYTNENGETRVAQYAHLSETSVSEGDKVTEGQIVGKTGTTGNADKNSPHLHFELRNSETPGSGLNNRVDPNEILDTKFTSQDTDATQSTTGVIKFEKNGKVTKQNINGTEKIINGPKIKPIDDKIRGL